MISLKAKTFWIACFLALPQCLLGQPNSGVYKTFEDYKDQKMVYVIDCSKENHKIKVNDLSRKTFITVIHDGVARQIPKDSVFGYQLCDGKFIRFVDNLDHQLLEKGDVWIYKRTPTKFPKGEPQPTLYFFSLEGGKPAPLTLDNLKNAFPNNHKLHDALTAQFKDDFELSSFDSFHKKYKVNHILEMSKE